MEVFLERVYNLYGIFDVISHFVYVRSRGYQKCSGRFALHYIDAYVALH